MKLKLKNYKEQLQVWPQEGYHLMAQYDDEKIIVYQSYRKEISEFAVQNQYFGGLFSLERMTWIKPNFLWMMYRNGWGKKEGQEYVLAIHLKMDAFRKYLENAIYSDYNDRLGISREVWQNQVRESSARLQWDPDHDPFGAKLDRRAIQIGLRNNLIKSFAQDDILLIEDISEFVQVQHQCVLNDDLDNLVTPEEKMLLFDDEDLNKKLRLK
ncbi:MULTISPECIES: DUF4291 domain-containing protein [Chryseobacterium]|uniref:DUF4291 domain-containing protein n=1 Tax=Chryseobacterium camelliae TaxID=1265445 RepID=A0ABU0TMG8_9FLAO|nr:MULTISPECIES: DUF4291 domain-containing protein [Chryseobacterium]MDT3407910.1 hypothetical protein [Pseudacidovorax intermedius]MDQ1098233.1 hypothetical protein [Chryseobacterium camelliae]MDQ1102160.1 hypothetical protein [Chryseobacterium sp. SORGH_AS_1048]MDR6085598.1 hypothetical protein [Chryseobacterium sp. SORGH_AS_0909]MDR6129960.1 hypothetical protein [Chryseobacterium sp. SORGH_AS_1175]